VIIDAGNDETTSSASSMDRVPSASPPSANPSGQSSPLTESTTSTHTSTSTTVNLVLTEATLLSGNLDDCWNADDDSCVGGVAAVSALTRHYSLSGGHRQPVLVFPKFEKQSQFVQVHPLRWSVNRLILQGIMGWNVFMSTPSLLLLNAQDGFGSQHDLTYLQSTEFPLLITNVAVPPSISWQSTHQYIYYHETTGIALISIANNGEPLNIDQVQATWGALTQIADRNKQSGCVPLSPQEQERQDLFQTYQEIYLNGPSSPTTTSTRQPYDLQNITTTTTIPPQQKATTCWIPVVNYADRNLDSFVEEIMQHPYPPLLIVDIAENSPDLYPMPLFISVPTKNNDNNNQTMMTTTLMKNTSAINTPLISNNDKSKYVWIHSYDGNEDVHVQHQLHIDFTTQPPTLLNVTVIQYELETALPVEFRDEIYAHHIQLLRQQADQAIANDPIVGYSTAFPVARDGEYRQCQGGECQIANLFTDALRWHAQADVAFVASGGLRGEGWPAGPVHISNIWASFPFPNSVCTGIISGKSLFQLLDYSIATSTFEGWDSDNGDRLLQVSGINIVYNTAIPQGQSRILSIHVWKEDTQQWQHVERLELYKFATDSYLCSAYDPYPDLLGANGNFTFPGEVPASIGDALVQNVVGDYLGQLQGAYYNASIQGRLVNNTNDFTVLDMAETEESCEANQYWSGRRAACFPCPDSNHVEFSDARLEFQGQRSGDGSIVPTEDSPLSSFYNATEKWNVTDDPALFKNAIQGRILLVNRELSNFSVVPKAIPSWLKFVEGGQLSERFLVGGPTTTLPSGSSLALDFIVGDENLKSGTALGTVSFGILGGSVEGDEGIRSCDDYSSDATFDVFLRITPPLETNELGDLRFIGIGIMCVTLATAAFFGFCLFKYRDMAILKTMQVGLQCGTEQVSARCCSCLEGELTSSCCPIATLLGDYLLRCLSHGSHHAAIELG
jgi:5'-nucleotidase, C-terminal domain